MAIAIDTNVLNYLVEAVWRGEETFADGTLAAAERLAVVRLMMAGEFLFVGKVAIGEAVHPANPLGKELERFVYNLLGELSIDAGDVPDWKMRAAVLGAYHPGEKNRNDCLIVAEAELAGCECLLTFDRKLKSRLFDRALIPVRSPTELWSTLSPLPTQQWKPHPASPLGQSTAWKW